MADLGVDARLVRSATAVAPAGDAESGGPQLSVLRHREETDGRPTAVSLAGVQTSLQNNQSDLTQFYQQNLTSSRPAQNIPLEIFSSP